ncbi:MAG TPA: LysM peptidoglycan-binding domain-containing protein [Marmoricola sp.]|nr:LysM peptidoglycan-binding domain-containing protein [Marmoricola sp.]
MSTLSISPAFRPARRPAHRTVVERVETRASTVRLTRRGRIVFVLLFLAVAFVVMVGLGGWATATHDAGTPDPVRIVEVQEGDTLYGIAGKISEPGKVREMVHEIQQLNSLPGGGLQVGQKLAIPAK